MEVAEVLWMVTLADNWVFAHNRRSYYWVLLWHAQDFIAKLRNTGQSGSMGWVDVCVLVCSPRDLIDPFCIEVDCGTPCCDISEAS